MSWWCVITVCHSTVMNANGPLFGKRRPDACSWLLLFEVQKKLYSATHLGSSHPSSLELSYEIGVLMGLYADIGTCFRLIGTSPRSVVLNLWRFHRKDNHKSTHVKYLTGVSLYVTEYLSLSEHLTRSNDELCVDQPCGHGSFAANRLYYGATLT